MIIKYFDIVVIIEFGNFIFGKIGINIVMFFLRRKLLNFCFVDYFRNWVDDWFFKNDLKKDVFNDNEIIKEYCEIFDINFSDYKVLISGKFIDKIKSLDFVKEYLDIFNLLIEVKFKKKKKIFLNLILLE